jgi:cyanophycinase
MSRPTFLLPLLLLAFLAPACELLDDSGQSSIAPELHVRGPKGYLLIVGGGGTTADMYERAILLGGGRGVAKVVVFPQASELPDTGESSAQAWLEAGAGVARVADTKDEAAALALIRDSGIIWFPGGVQSRLMQALGVNLPGAIRKRYQDGAVIGGTSAGAAVMSSVMLTGEVEGDSPDDDGLGFVRSQTVETKPGIGLVDWGIVDQHFVRRKRFNRMLSCVLDHPDLVGVGIDERTAILVHDREFEVIGESNVLVLDARHASNIEGKKGERPTAHGLRMQVLAHGMRYSADD